MKPTIRTPRGPVVIIVALLAALLVAACGGSSNSGGSGSKNASKTTTTSQSTTPANGATATRTALAACLKKNGVSLGRRGAGGFGFRGGTTTNGTTTTSGGFSGGGTPPSGGGTPPSGAAGGGFPGGGAGGFAGRNSKFAKAIAACDKTLGIKAGAGFGAGRFRGGAGGSGFTPHFSTVTLKSYVACIRKNGYAAMPEPKASKTGSFFPKSVESNAQFKAANKKCESVLLKAFRSVRPGAAGAGGTSAISGSSTVSSA